MADALGVGREVEAEAEAKPAEEATPQNRAARRAEAAQRRKKRKTAVARSTEEEAADEALPRDKNARAKELLKRRREQAGEGAARPIQLLPGEMVDDALARGSSALGKWFRENFGIIQWVFLGALAAGGAYLFYVSRTDATAAKATDALMAGVNADRGQVMPEDKRSDDEKEVSPLKVFKTADERADTALAGYKKVLVDHAGTGAAILAHLGEAGDYLDKRDWDHAIEGFSAVAASTLASADADVKARALEGLGFAKEGKGDVDGAIATFKDLEAVTGAKELGLYHEGRIYLAKGDKEKAKELLKQVHDKLEQPTGEGQPRYLQGMTDELLHRIDPTMQLGKAPVIGGAKGGAQTPEEIARFRRMFEDAMKKGEKGEKGEQHP